VPNVIAGGSLGTACVRQERWHSMSRKPGLHLIVTVVRTVGAGAAVAPTVGPHAQRFAASRNWCRVRNITSGGGPAADPAHTEGRPRCRGPWPVPAWGS
jgi:hypothetical protein